MNAVRKPFEQGAGALGGSLLRRVGRHPKPSVAQAAACGAIGGVVGASCMTVLRTMAQRAGIIEKSVPQVVEEWATDRLGVEPPGGPAGHQITDQVLHFGYGMVGGILYGGMLGPRRPPILLGGVAFGFVEWAIGFFVLIPALQVHRPAHKATLSENLINIGAHLAYGLATALLTDELSQQTDRGPRPDVLRFAARVG
jgi:hypothetical protein